MSTHSKAKGQRPESLLSNCFPSLLSFFPIFFVGRQRLDTGRREIRLTPATAAEAAAVTTTTKTTNGEQQCHSKEKWLRIEHFRFDGKVAAEPIQAKPARARPARANANSGL